MIQINNKIPKSATLKKEDSKTIILGSKGFIGSYLESHLKRYSDTPVFGFGSQECDLTKIDSCAKALTPLIENSNVIFCSSILRLPGEPKKILDTNLLMASNFIRIAENGPPKSLIFMSSTDVYGRPPSASPMNEDSPAIPTGNYGKSKLESELLFAQKLKGLITLLRLPGIYGASDKGSSIVSKFVQKIKNGEQITLDGKGQALRDYFHVQNICDVVCALLQTKSRENSVETYNLATGKSISLIDLVQVIGAYFKIEPQVCFNLNCEPQYDFIFDVKKLHKDFSKIHWISLKEGVSLY